MDIYSRYAPFIQDYIYRNNWEKLRAVQMAAGEAIFNTEENVLLCASTASGKTEAAFFPILTEFMEEPPLSIGCIYIAPLKSLINDQFIRLNDLCEEAGIAVWHWHGDVSQSHKNKMLKNPSGILQITPESLEAMLIRRHSFIPKLFGDLRFIVIDEIHSFIRSDRGGQTLCLIERLSRIAGVKPRRIGLSATVGDPKEVGEFLAAGSGRGTVIPKIKDGGVTWHLSMEQFYKTEPQAGNAHPETALKAADPGMAYIYEHTRGKKCLVFSNSREECEAVTSTMHQYSEALNEKDRFLIHHGNLSASFRETAEDLMKREEENLTTCTTATLELGIDIGRLERAFQIDAPFTVSSFLQRMGRTGRRDLPPEMWFVMIEEHAESRAMLPETIPWKLLQGAALVQIYLEERWVEPMRKGRLPYSLLYHQTMSTLVSSGEMTPAELASKVLSLYYFRDITKDDYRTLLRHLIETDHIEQTENGGLIVGLAGERVTNNFKFFAVFQENEEYSVRCESEELGTIVKPPPVGDKIAIAGRVWVVESVDIKRHQVYCHMVKGQIPAYFGEVPGDINTRILERMLKVLREDKIYPYLMANAGARLAEARANARISGITEKPLIALGGNMYCLIPWLGTYAFLALERFLKIRCAKRLKLKGFDSVRPYYMQFTMGVSEKEFFEILSDEIAKPIDPMELVYPKEVPVFERYDEMLPESLIRKGFAYGVLNIDEMKTRVMQWSPDKETFVIRL